MGEAARNFPPGGGALRLDQLADIVEYQDKASRRVLHFRHARGFLAIKVAASGNRAFDGINLPVGDMTRGQFGVVGEGLTGRESILYDPATGTLATHGGKVFARLDPGLALTFHDFVWIVDYP